MRAPSHFPARESTSVFSCALILALHVSVVGVVAQTSAPRTAAPGTVVFVVNGEVGSEGKSIDALVVVDGGRFKAPYGDQELGEAKKFADRYYRPGAKYRVTFGGGDAGTFTVGKAAEGCNDVHANGTAETTAPIRGRVMGLATNSDTLGRRESARRAPDPAEREAVLKLVKDIYRRRKTPASWLERMEVTNLAATDLDGDGRYEMIGSFVIETRQKLRRDLFLIAAPQGGAGFRADFVNFQSYKLPPEGFASAVDFLDQLDMDGDGVGEVVTIDGGFDAYGYSVYKKRRGRWVKVHSGLGDAC